MSVSTDRRARVLALVVAGLLLVAGCGGGSTTTGGSPTTDARTTDTAGETGETTGGAPGTGLPPDACLLITQADIAAALQLNVLEGQLFDEGDVTVCAFESADHFSTVEVSRYEPVGDLVANTSAADPNAEDVTGVGDEAVAQMDLGRLTMRVGEVGVVITSAPDPELDGLVQLARIAVGSEAREPRLSHAHALTCSEQACPTRPWKVRWCQAPRWCRV